MFQTRTKCFVSIGWLKFCGGNSNLLRKRFNNDLNELFLFTGMKGYVTGLVIQRPHWSLETQNKSHHGSWWNLKSVVRYTESLIKNRNRSRPFGRNKSGPESKPQKWRPWNSHWLFLHIKHLHWTTENISHKKHLYRTEKTSAQDGSYLQNRESGQTPFGVLWALLGPILKGGCAGLGKGPEEVHKNDPWNEEPVVWGTVEDSGSVLLGVQKDEGGSSWNLQDTARPG